MGALPNVFPGYQPVTATRHREKFEQAWGVKLSRQGRPAHPGNARRGRARAALKAMYIMGENPVLTDPDANHVRKAMGKLDFLVVQDMFLTETAKYADVVLPAACFAEKDGTFTNTERRVQRVRKAVEPPGSCRPDWQIICDLSRRLGHPMDFASPEADHRGDARADAQLRRHHLRAPRARGGLQWPCPTTDHPGTQFLHAGSFTRGKGLLNGIEYQAPAELTTSEYPILLTTGRMLFHYNIMTRHSLNLEWLRPHELAEIHPADAEALGVGEGDQVRVTSRRGSIVTRVTVTDKVPHGTVFMTFHYKESPVNELTNSAYDPVTKTAEFKVCAVRVKRIEAAEEAI